jgi:hypothetical protein
MTVVERFRATVDRLDHADLAGPARLPSRLSTACAQVLPVAGAGLGVFSAPTMRLPIGASDDTAETAERLQFTVAQGPCFHAHHTRRCVVAPAPVIAARWPLFYDELITHTPVRGIVSMPLSDGLAGVGVLDLYFHQPQDPTRIDPDDLQDVADDISTRLVEHDIFPTDPDGRSAEDSPAWLDNPTATGRGYVVLAMGMISMGLNLKLDDSLATLRGHAFAANRTVDRIARDIVNRDLPVTDLG